MNANGNPPLRSRLRATLELFVVLLLMMLLAALSVRAEELPPPVALDGVGCGSLLLATAEPGLYLPAPNLDTEVAIEVTGFIARTWLRQRFQNPAGEWVEGVYVFPLPDAAAVDTLRLRVGDREIEGQIHERRAAQQIYDEANQEGKKAALVEQQRPNIFTMSIARLGPDEVVEIELEYQEELRYDQGTLHLRFPMVVGPRYLPDSSPKPRTPAFPPLALTRSAGFSLAAGPGLAEDGARISPPILLARAARGDDTAPINPIRLSVALRAGFPVARLQSPSHAIDVRALRPGDYEISLDGRATADRDFALEWAPARGSEPHAMLFTEEWKGEFYSLLVVQPPSRVSANRVSSGLEREVTFVLDTSGSMSGESIHQAKAALGLALDRLAPEDHFNVIEFNSRARRLWPGPLPAYVEHVEEARRWVEGLEADGGTEILAALLLALDGPAEGSARDQKRIRQVVFVTDGCVGNEDVIFREIRAGLGETRLFTVGIGSAPNAHFLRQAAAAGRGSYTFVGRPEDVRTHMADLLRKLESPVLADVAVVWDEAGAAPIPERVPDLHAGEPLVVVAKLANLSGVTVSGLGQEAWSDRVELDRALTGKGIHAVWARRRIAELEDTALDGAGEDEIRADIVEVALSHRLVSRHTSLVAVDVRPTATGALPPARHLPVHLPAGWDGAAFGELPQGGTPARLYLACALGMLLAAAGMVLPRGGRS